MKVPCYNFNASIMFNGSGKSFSDMGLKVFERSTLVKNELGFIVLSLILVHTVLSFSAGQTIFDTGLVIDTVKNLKMLLLLGVISAVMIYRLDNKSDILITFFSAGVCVKLATEFYVTEDKLTLFFLFFYACISYFFITFWKIEMDEPFYVPGYSKNDVERRYNERFPVRLEVGGKEKIGSIVNAGKKGCYVRLEGHEEIKQASNVKLKIDFSDYQFESVGRVVSTYSNDGVGIKVANDEEETELGNWNDFFEIINDRGFFRSRYE